jgi:hypothetical protein
MVVFLQLRLLKCTLFSSAGSKTREGVVQGVASGTSPALAQCFIQMGGMGVLPGEGSPWATM